MLKAGIIPYYVKDDIVHCLTMKPSDPKFGGKDFQIAKGTVENGSILKTAFIEGKEELGLRIRNVEYYFLVYNGPMGTSNKNLKITTINTTFFAAKIKNENDFGKFHYETGEVKWIPLVEKNYELIRFSHIHVFKKLNSLIKNLDITNTNVVKYIK